MNVITPHSRHRAIAPSLSFAMCVLMLARASAASGATATTLPSEVRAALESHARQLDPITVGSTDVLTGEAPGQPRRERRTARHLTWQEGNLYCYSKDGRGEGGVSEFSFDGKLFYSGSGDGGLVTKTNPESSEPFVSADYFEMAGVSVPTTSRDLLARQASSMVLRRMSEPGGALLSVDTVTVEGHELLRVRMHVPNEVREAGLRTTKADVVRSVRTWSNKEEDINDEWKRILSIRAMPPVLVESFYLDPQLNYAVRKFERRYQDGTLLREYENSDFERLAGRDLWMPRKCLEHRYIILDHKRGVIISEKPVYTWTCEATLIVPGPITGVSFALEYTKPGTLVTDRSNPNAEKAYMIPRPTDLGDRRPWYRRPHVLFVILNVVVAGWLVVYYRRRQRLGQRK